MRYTILVNTPGCGLPLRIDSLDTIATYRYIWHRPERMDRIPFAAFANVETHARMCAKYGGEMRIAEVKIVFLVVPPTARSVPYCVV